VLKTYTSKPEFKTQELKLIVQRFMFHFSWYEPMWLENLGFCDLGEGWKLTDEGVTAMDGSLPVNMSGGVLSSNPIGASGMIRFGEAALQVMGLAEDHQVEDAKISMGHAYGGAAQFFAMWIVSSTKD
tara:strand:- start:324 stop:707 length:384 start_codon:yes stop_codon:yes gene_type:complete